MFHSEVVVRCIEESGLTANSQATSANLVELACSRANERPDRTAYVFLQDGENESGRLTFAELDRRARVIAARLQRMGMAGERALLLYPPGFDYIEGFFGCLYAGVVAVPASLPTRRQKSRLLAVISDAAPAVIMTTADIEAKFRNELAPTIEKAVWLATDQPEAESAEHWIKPALGSDSLAFLQYTSGSTGDPKGVMVSHGNLMANQEAIKQGFGHTENTTVVGWLPLYHDMGLIGNLLQPLYLGATAVLMPPMAFLEKPARWLKAISDYRANTSGGPNFAYDLCCRKVTAEQMQALDLSAWTLAFNGSEPVRAVTLERFAEKFAGCGFRKESFFSCYGLAEATLYVSGEKLPSAGYAERPEEKSEVRTVSCGPTSDRHEIRIVDPETSSPRQDGCIGEIWVAGPSVAQGYWNRPEASEQTFRARWAGKPGMDRSKAESSAQSFLRTGDLGCLDNGRLYITGRIKDLIIIRGRNFYPQDIEQALTGEIPALVPEGCAVFSISQDEEQLIVVAEITRTAMRSGDYAAIAAAVRNVLAEVCELAAAELILVQAGAVPKTSSGKIRRQPCKQMYLENSLPVLFRSGDAPVECAPVGEQGGLKALEENSPEYQLLRQALWAVPQAQRAPLITRFLKHRIARLLKVEESLVATDSPLRSLGLDSLKAVELKYAADDLLGTDAPLSLFLSDDSLEKIAEKLSETPEFPAEHAVSIKQADDSDNRQKALSKGRGLGDDCMDAGGTTPRMGEVDRVGNTRSRATQGAVAEGKSKALNNSTLSATQFSMWTMQHLEPNSIVYNLHLALCIAGALERERLRQAFRCLAERHPMLRTVYRTDGNGGVIQRVLPIAELPDFFTAVDASAWPEAQLQSDMARRAAEPFDLATGPLLRIACYAHGKPELQNDPLCSPEGSDGQSLPIETCHTLLICAHHIAVDLWSVLILVSELKTIYAELSAGAEVQLNALPSDYTDFVAWQSNYLKSPASEKAWAYWQRQLTGELPLLSLPTDRPRPAVPDYRGASLAFGLSRDETEQLKKLAGQRGVTLFTLLLTAYKVLLHRYTHQKDVIVGVPASGRSQSRFAPIVGNFVNPLPLRSYPSGNKPFTDYLAEVNGSLLSALEHQDFPFSLTVERLQPERIADHWPIYQTLFVLQQAQAGVDADLAQLALGEDGEPLFWGDRKMRPLNIHQRIERFDLKLMAAECEDGLLLSFQYRCDLFTVETVNRIAAHFRHLLSAVMANPEARIASLPLIGDSERNKLLYEWNASVEPFSEDICMHRLVESQAAKTPNAVAVVCNEQRLTYRELDISATHWAHRLIACGVGLDARVGICVERSVNLIIGMLAVLKTGAAYVPIDSDFPPERVVHTLDDAGAEVLLTQSNLYETAKLPVTTRLNMDEEQAKAMASIVNKRFSVMPGQAAYVIYTSGSTGQSKGVSVSHRSLVNYTQAIIGQIQAKTGLQYALMSTPAADLGNTVLFSSLVSGGCLHILDHDTVTDGRLMADYIADNPIDVMKIVPSHFAALLDSAEGKNIVPRRTLIFGGDVLQNALIARVTSIRPECRVFNHYGPTEATIGALTYPVAMEAHGNILDTSVPIGRPIANSQAYILDENLEPVPIGVPGELYIGGRGVAQGYLNRPDLTAERFIPDPFSGLESEADRSLLNPKSASGARLYRTGDRARYRADGLVEFLGRADHQLKIRGFRIEPGEIEARLCTHPDVSDALVIAWEDAPGVKRLAAYIVPINAEPDQETLRLHVRNALPDYMVPSVFVFLEKWPLTPNGKLDRKALPKPDPGSYLAHQYVGPRNDAEASLAAIWAEVLRVGRVGIHDNFFSLGGDSILSIQMASRVRQAGLSLSPRLIFQYQTIADLVPRLEKLEKFPGEFSVTKTLPEQNKVAVTEFPLASLTLEEIDQIRQAVPDVQDIYPTTSMQAGLLFHTLLHPHSGVYLMQHRYWIEGSVDVDVFREAWQRIVDRHSILRTIFFWDTQSQPHQVVKRRTILPFDYYDWQDLPDCEQEARLEDLLATERRDGFDLGSAPPLRIKLFRLGDRRYLLIRSHHHILLDAWCTSLILTELKDHYANLIQHERTVEDVGPAFSDYIAWLLQRNMAAAEQFWRSYLQGFSEPTPLAIDRPITDDQQMIREVKDVRRFLSEETTEALQTWARHNHLTLNTMVQAAWALLLSRYSGHREVLFGITVAGRPAELPDIEAMLGLFINSLPLRVQIKPEQPLQEFLQNIQQQTLEIREFEYPSLTQIQQWCELPRGQDLFQHLLAFENAPVDPVLHRENGTWWFVNSRHRTHTNYPLNGVVIPGSKLYLQISYQDERFESERIERMLDHWQHLLVDMVCHSDKRVGELSMFPNVERRRMLIDWNRTAHVYPGPCDVISQFELTVERNPTAIAAACLDKWLTYGELNARANRVAHALVSEGAEPETLVALYSERGINYLVMMLGAFKAGIAYLPLDPSHPDERNIQVLKESGARWILTCASYFERASVLADRTEEIETKQTPPSLSMQLRSRPDVFVLEELQVCEHTENPFKRHSQDNLAFVIFTSGSTGMPKGAMVEYKGMFNNLITKVPTLGLTERDVIAQTAGQCFDISVWQHLTALVCGARIEIFPDEIVKEPYRLLAQLTKRGVTVLESVPSMIQALLDSADDAVKLPELRWLIACGEAFPPELCRRWMAWMPHVRVLNAYGPAECSDDVSYYEVSAVPCETETIVPIGRPVHNTRLYLLDQWLGPVPAGVPGEICVAGIQVGRGYLYRPELTAEKFIPDPFDSAGTRLYRTGDLGRYREDGSIEFLGRIDHQVKIRGVRIEPGEIETHLLTFSGVAQALVAVRESGVSGKQLVAYVVYDEQVFNSDAELFTKLREHLSARLPDAMMPSAFVRLDAMPLSANGKIDRKALPAPDMAGQSDCVYVAPRNPAEEILAGIWKEVLGLERVGVMDNFFDLGGHSLLAVQVLSRIRRAFGIEVPLRRIFDAATIEASALLVEELLIEHLNSLSEEEAEALLNDGELDNENTLQG